MNFQSRVLFSDPNAHGWQSFVPYKWELSHRPNEGIINFKIYEGNSLIVSTGDIIDFTHSGGRLGVFCFSQEMIRWSGMSYKCNGKYNFLKISH